MDIFAKLNTTGDVNLKFSVFGQLIGGGETGINGPILNTSSIATIATDTIEVYRLIWETPYVDISIYSAIIIKIIATAVTGSHTITTYYESPSTYSHIHTSFDNNIGSFFAASSVTSFSDVSSSSRSSMLTNNFVEQIDNNIIDINSKINIFKCTTIDSSYNLPAGVSPQELILYNSTPCLVTITPIDCAIVGVKSDGPTGTTYSSIGMQCQYDNIKLLYYYDSNDTGIGNTGTWIIQSATAGFTGISD